VVGARVETQHGDRVDVRVSELDGVDEVVLVPKGPAG